MIDLQNKSPKLLVIGDLIIDQYLWGNCERISPEAPVPLVGIEDERFMLGGGVMQQDHLFPMIRERVIARLAEYIDVPRVENYIVPPGLGAQAGVLGSLALAQDLLK